LSEAVNIFGDEDVDGRYSWDFREPKKNVCKKNKLRQIIFEFIHNVDQKE
jgi:hypothetical protein